MQSHFVQASIEEFGNRVRSLNPPIRDPVAQAADALGGWYGERSPTSASKREAWSRLLAALAARVAAPQTGNSHGEGSDGPCWARSIEWVTKATLSGAYSRSLASLTCAVVGSGAVLNGAGHGPAIDAHDVVVHINNLPHAHMRGDMGSRTDVFFGTLCAVFRGGTEIQDDGERTCEFASDCPFRAAIFRSELQDECEDGRQKLERAAPASAIPLGVSSELASNFVTHLRREDTDPSTGFNAVITMALACASVSLFGFSGSGTVDDHFIGHNIEAEHALLRQLVNHTMPDDAFPNQEAADRWRTAVVMYGS